MLVSRQCVHSLILEAPWLKLQAGDFVAEKLKPALSGFFFAQ
jgi:hypothetical protein